MAKVIVQEEALCGVGVGFWVLVRVPVTIRVRVWGIVRVGKTDLVELEFVF